MSDKIGVWMLFFIIVFVFTMGTIGINIREDRYLSLADKGQVVEKFQCYSGKGCSALIKEADQSSHWVWLEIYEKQFRRLPRRIQLGE